MKEKHYPVCMQFPSVPPAFLDLPCSQISMAIVLGSLQRCSEESSFDLVDSPSSHSIESHEICHEQAILELPNGRPTNRIVISALLCPSLPPQESGCLGRLDSVEVASRRIDVSLHFGLLIYVDGQVAGDRLLLTLCSVFAFASSNLRAI